MGVKGGGSHAFEVAVMVHSAGILLAAGAGPAGAVSPGLAGAASVPAGGHRGGGRFRTGARYFLSSCPHAPSALANSEQKGLSITTVEFSERSEIPVCAASPDPA